MINATDQARIAFWGNWEWLGVGFIAPAFLHSVFLLTDERRKLLWTILRLGYLVGAVFAFLAIFTDVVLYPPRPIAYLRQFSSLTFVGYYLPLVFLLLVSIGLFKLWYAYRMASGQRKTQMRYLFWSLVIGYVGGSPDWALALGFYVPILNPFGIYGVPLYSIATTYAVLQHRLFDFNLVIRKSLVYSLVVTVLTVSYFGLIYGIERFWRGTAGYQSPWISLAAFALMALVFQPLKMGIQRVIDQLVFRAPHEELVRRVERLEQEVRQSEKMKSVATLAAGLAHEIRNPLTAIQTFARYLPERHEDPDFRRLCGEIVVGEVNRVNELIQQLIDFARPRPPSVQPTDLHRLIRTTLDFLSNETVRRRVGVEKRLEAADPSVRVDGNQMRQVIMNLVLNALDAMAPGGTLTVATARNNGNFVIQVQDTGCGIPSRELPRIFDPFRTTKPQGSGLGLSVAYGLIREHRGTITVMSRVGQGTTFTIKLPA